MKPTSDGDELTADILADEIAGLIADGLIAVTGAFPEWRFCPTPAGQVALQAAEEHEARVCTSARELAMRRHPAAHEGVVIPLFTAM